MSGVLITGSTEGLGLMAARLLAGDGHSVTLHARSAARAEDARAALPEAGRYLVRRSDDEIQIFRIEDGWTRIGRSVAADIRLDHPSVSRRHALIISEEDASLRVLDDRSLNGVLVNGEEIEWGKLEDGDELRIGRYQLFVLEA